MAPTRKARHGITTAGGPSARPAERMPATTPVSAKPPVTQLSSPTTKVEPSSRMRLADVTADRDRLKVALKAALARLNRLEARESVVQDHLTKAIATIDRLLSGN